MEESSQLCPHKQNSWYPFNRGWVGLSQSRHFRQEKFIFLPKIRTQDRSAHSVVAISTTLYLLLIQPVLSPELSEHLITIRCKTQKMPLMWTAAIKPGYLYKVYLGFAWSIVEFWECHERNNIIRDVAVWQTVTAATNDSLVTVCST